jgi:hypothetical protein
MDRAAMDSIPALYPDQQVLHNGRRATYLHMTRGEAIIRYWGGSHAVAVPPDTLRPWRSPARTWRPLAPRDEPLARDLAARRPV